MAGEISSQVSTQQALLLHCLSRRCLTAIHKGKRSSRRPQAIPGGDLMHTITKLVLGGTALSLLSEGLSQVALKQSLEREDPVKRLDAEQASQAFKVLGLVGSGFFWYGCYKHSPRLTVGLGVATTALVSAAVIAPKVIKLFDPKGWERAQASIHSRHRVPAPLTPVVTGGAFVGAPRQLYHARHPFEPQQPHMHQHHHHR
jgi:hypothetical protein